jgi:hypothetical protein
MKHLQFAFKFLHYFTILVGVGFWSLTTVRAYNVWYENPLDKTSIPTLAFSIACLVQFLILLAFARQTYKLIK